MAFCSSYITQRNNAQTVEIAKGEDEEQFENMRWYAGWEKDFDIVKAWSVVREFKLRKLMF